jgi:hypothetical protein
MFMNSTSLYESQISNRIIQIFELSGALWVHICLLEVTLREAINSTLKNAYSRMDWWNSPLFSSPNDRRYFIQITKRLNGHAQTFGPNIHLQHFSLSFWVRLLGNKYVYRVWRHLENLSPTLKAYGRRNFQQKAIIIRDLRNAIAHHAPILHRNLARDLAYMHELTDLLSPGLAKVLKTQSKAGSLVKLLKTNTPGAKF